MGLLPRCTLGMETFDSGSNMVFMILLPLSGFRQKTAFQAVSQQRGGKDAFWRGAPLLPLPVCVSGLSLFPAIPL